MSVHRGVNRSPNLPDAMREFFRGTSKQEWAEIAYDLAVQHRGGDESVFSDVFDELDSRREIVRDAEKRRKAIEGARSAINAALVAVAAAPEGGKAQ